MFRGDDGTFGPHRAMSRCHRGPGAPASRAGRANLVLDNGESLWNSTCVLGSANAPAEAQGANVPFDGRREDWEGPRCKGCKELIEEGQPTTAMHFHHDPDGDLGMTGRWHSECARP